MNIDKTAYLETNMRDDVQFKPRPAEKFLVEEGVKPNAVVSPFPPRPGPYFCFTELETLGSAREMHKTCAAKV